MNNSFWSRADGMSIIDLLALTFSTVYLFLILHALLFDGGDTAIQLQGQMNFAISTILGGYFGDQMVQHYQKSKEKQVDYEYKDIDDGDNGRRFG